MANTNDGNSTWSRSPVYSFNKGLHRYNEYNDPTYLGFVFMFDYTNSPLFKSGVGGAVDYLNRTGESLRATYLQTFIDTLYSINMNMPWYWQSFEGAENLWKYNNFTDPYKGGDDSIITISCLESIDLKMTMLIDLYRKAVYDQQYKRIILPENLRKFEMYIYIQEIRKFHIAKYFNPKNPVKTSEPASSLNPGNDEQKNSELYKNENTPYILWLLKYCEIDPDTSAVPFTGLNNLGDSTGFAKQAISIKYELVEEPGNFYPSFDSTVSSTEPNKSVNNEKPSGAEGGLGSPEKDDRSKLQKKYDSAKKRVTETSKSMSEDYEKRVESAAFRYKENALEEARNFASGKLSSVVLGNVYGSTRNILASLEQGSVASLGPDVINQVNKINKNSIKNNLGNAFD